MKVVQGGLRSGGGTGRFEEWRQDREIWGIETGQGDLGNGGRIGRFEE